MSLWMDLKHAIQPNQNVTASSRQTAAASSQTQAKKYPEAPKIRMVFMGTPDISATILRALAAARYNIVGVVTKADRPQGRKQEITGSPVKQAAQELALPVFQPFKLNEEAVSTIAEWKPDIIVVAAYGKILPTSLLELPGFGCINVHASLLPRWRGASPVQNALLSGDQETGVTIMLMDAGMDTGDILSQEAIAIAPDETAEELLARLTDVGTALLLRTIPQWIARALKPTPQKNDQATLCQLIEREDGRIMWTDSADTIYNRYRALFPWPGIFTYWKKDDSVLRLKLLRVALQKQSPQTEYQIGQVFELGDKVGVQTGAGVIFLDLVQLEGKAPMPLKDFLRGNPNLIGGLLQ